MLTIKKQRQKIQSLSFRVFGWKKDEWKELLFWLLGKSMGFRQSIRRPRPNPLKLSGFVEIFAVIILVIDCSQREPILKKTQVRYFFDFFCIFCKKWKAFFRKINDHSSPVHQILKPITYSDFSWETASQSIEILKIVLKFKGVSLFTIEGMNTKSVRKLNRQSGMNENSDTGSSIEQHLLYNLH